MKGLVWFRNTFKSRYVASLEAEIDRLRTELRRWQDVVLSSRGLPSISLSEPHELPKTKQKLLPSQWRAKMEAASSAKEPNG